jgi:uridylate kinase
MRYTRILLKLSGEVLGGARGFGIDPDTLGRTADELVEVHASGTQVAVVIGGGNFWRGVQGAERGTDRATGDYMGMLATVMNACSLQDALQKRGCPARVLSALTIVEVAEPYVRRNAIEHLEAGRLVIFAAGTGNPFFTTDTAAALRACEIGAKALLKATKVRGIYSADPVKHPDATFYPRITFQQAIEEHLRVMDTTALSLCQENDVPVHVFDMGTRGNILRIIHGDDVGTVVTNGDRA